MASSSCCSRFDVKVPEPEAVPCSCSILCCLLASLPNIVNIAAAFLAAARSRTVPLGRRSFRFFFAFFFFDCRRLAGSLHASATARMTAASAALTESAEMSPPQIFRMSCSNPWMRVSV